MIYLEFSASVCIAEAIFRLASLTSVNVSQFEDCLAPTVL